LNKKIILWVFVFVLLITQFVLGANITNNNITGSLDINGSLNITGALNNTLTGTVTIENEDFLVLPTIIGLGIVAALLLYLAAFLTEEHFLGKLLLIFFALFAMIQIPNVIINGVAATSDNFLKLMMNLQRIFFLYIFIYLNYYIWLHKKLVDLGWVQEKKQTVKYKG